MVQHISNLLVSKFDKHHSEIGNKKRFESRIITQADDRELFVKVARRKH